MLNKIKEFFVWIGVILAAAVGVFLFGKSSVPQKLTAQELQEFKTEVENENKNKTNFELLNDLDKSKDLLR